MNNREILDFLNAVDDARNRTGLREGLCIGWVAEVLGVAPPTADSFIRMRLHKARLTRRRSRGRPRASGMTKSEAVAAVTVYFESIGARPEQALAEAQRWLGVRVSRKVAKAAITDYRNHLLPQDAVPWTSQCYLLANFAYATFKPGTTQALPTQLAPTTQHGRKRRYS